MLSKQNISLVVLSFKICSLLGFLPFTIQTYELAKNTPRNWGYIIHPLLLVNCCMYTSFLLVRLFQECIKTQSKDHMYNFPFHLLYIIGFLWLILCDFQLFYLEANLNLKVCNQLVRGLPSEHAKLTSLSERFLAALPVLLLSFGVAMTTIYCYNPRSPQYMFSVFAPSGVTTTLLCMFYELHTLFSFVAIGNYVIFNQILFMRVTSSMLEDQLSELREDVDGTITLHQLTKCARNLRVTQLLSSFFNGAYANVTCTLKITCISVCIVCIFSCLKLVRRHPFIGTLSGVVGLLSWCIYIFVFDRGFALPSTFQACKHKVLKRLSLLPCKDKGFLMAKIRSLHKVEVGMGMFHAPERSSTLLFLDFVFSAIFNLIIGFPEPW